MAMALGDYAAGETEQEPLSDARFEKLLAEVSSCLERKKSLELARSAAVTEADKLREWGNFEPAQLDGLKAQGIELHFCRVDKKAMADIASDPEIRFIRLASVGKMDTLAILGSLPEQYAANEFKLPSKGLAELEQEAADCGREIADCEAILRNAAKYIPSFHRQMLKAAE